MKKIVFKGGFEETGSVLTETNRRQINFPGRKSTMSYDMKIGKHTKDYNQGISKITLSWNLGARSKLCKINRNSDYL